VSTYSGQNQTAQSSHKSKQAEQPGNADRGKSGSICDTNQYVKFVSHRRYVIFQIAEVAIPKDLVTVILRRIDLRRPTPRPT